MKTSELHTFEYILTKGIRVNGEDNPTGISCIYIPKIQRAYAQGRNGEFDQVVSSTVRRVKRNFRDDNSALVLVLPYLTAECENNHQSFHEYYDEIEICQDAAEGHYKAAIQVRNRETVDRSDLVVCCIEHNSGGAFQTVQYAKKKNKEIVNLSDPKRTI